MSDNAYNEEEQQQEQQPQQQYSDEDYYQLYQGYGQGGLQYDPSWWENPYNVAKAYNYWRSLPPGSSLPSWMDPKSLQQAYDYFSWANQGKGWAEWGYLDTNDPARQFLQGMQLPTPDFMLSKEDYQKIQFAEADMLPASQLDSKTLAQLPPSYQHYFQRKAMQEHYDQWNAAEQERLPGWHKAWQSLMDNPKTAPIVQMASMGWFTGGRDLRSLLGGAALGYAMTLPQSIDPTFEIGGVNVRDTAEDITMGLMKWFNVLSERSEQALGTGALLLGEMEKAKGAEAATEPFQWFGRYMEGDYGLEPEIRGTQRLFELLRDPEYMQSAREAARSTYETGVSYWAVNDFLGDESGTVTPFNEKLGYLSSGNLLPALEFGYLTLGNALGYDWGDIEKIQFLKPGEIWLPGRADPFTPQLYGIAALENTRRRILNGENPELVWQQNSAAFGMSGITNELVWGSILDPLNVIPEITATTASGIAKASGNLPLQLAFREAIGPVQGMQNYRNFLRTGVKNFDEMSGFEKWFAGYTETGTLKDFDPVYVEAMKQGSFVQRRMAWLMNLTAEARARYFVSMSADNMAVVLDNFRGDPKAQVEAFNRIADSPTQAALEWGKMYASGEMVSAKSAISAYAPIAREKLASWEANADSRAVLNLVAQTLGESPAKTLQFLGSSDDASITVDALRSRLQGMVGADKTGTAAALLEMVNKGEIDGKYLVELAKAYTGPNALPWHTDQFQADLWGDYVTKSGEWAVKAFGVTKPNWFIAFSDVAKKAQSLILLGYNPAYLVNNAMNNVVTRLAVGVFGYDTPTQKATFMARLGIHPYRFEAGGTVIDIMGEMDVHPAETAESGLGKLIGMTKRTGAELKIREAARLEKGTLAKASALLSRMNQYSLAPLSRMIEQAESATAFYYGIKRLWPSMWDGTFEELPPNLVQSLARIDPNLPSLLNAAMKYSMNPTEVMERIVGTANRYDPAFSLDATAKALRIDPRALQDSLSPIYDALERYLKDARDIEGVNAAFERIEMDLQKHFEDMAKQEITQRLQEMLETIKGEGIAGGVQIVDMGAMNAHEHIGNSFRFWQEVFNTAELLEADNAGKAKIDALFRRSRAIANREWNRARSMDLVVTQAMADVWGTDGRGGIMVDSTLKQHNQWNDYYKFVDKEYNAFNQQRGTFENQDAFNAAWYDLQTRLTEEYIATSQRIAAIQVEIDNALIESLRSVYGDAAAAQATKWRQDIAAFEQVRTNMMVAHRNMIIDLPKAQRRTAWKDFLDKEYLPFVRDYFNAQIQHAHKLYGVATGNEPPEAPTLPEQQVGNVTGTLPPEEGGPTPPETPPTQPPPAGPVPTEPVPPEAPPPPESLAPNAGYKEIVANQPPEAPPPPTPAQVAQARRAEIIKIGEEFGIGRNEGKHLLRTLKMKEYGGIPDLTSFDDPRLTPEVARQILENRRLEKQRKAVIESKRLENVQKLGQAGLQNEAYDADGIAYDMEYHIVELDDLVASHTTAMGVNPDFPPEAQPRDRTMMTSEDQVQEIIKTWNPAMILQETHRVAGGTQIVRPDLVVESGNGRTIAMRRMVENYPDKWRAYQDMLKKVIGDYGFAPEQLAQYRNPVLVRLRTDKATTADFVEAANKRENAAMSPQEMAIQDAKKLNPRMIANILVKPDESLGMALKRGDNADFVRHFFGGLSKTERANYVDRLGAINADAITRMIRAILAVTYPGETGVRIVESLSDAKAHTGMAAWGKTVLATLPSVSRLETRIEIGEIDPSFALAEDLALVTDRYDRYIIEQGFSVDDYLKQQNIFETPLTPFQVELLRFVEDNIKSQKAMRGWIEAYIEKVFDLTEKMRGLQQPDMFGYAPVINYRGKGAMMDEAAAEVLGQQTRFGRFDPANATVAPQAPIETPAEVPPLKIDQANELRLSQIEALAGLTDPSQKAATFISRLRNMLDVWGFYQEDIASMPVSQWLDRLEATTRPVEPLPTEAPPPAAPEPVAPTAARNLGGAGREGKIPTPEEAARPGVAKDFYEEIGDYVYFENNGDIYRAPKDSLQRDLTTGLPVNSRFFSVNNSDVLNVLNNLRRRDAVARGGGTSQQEPRFRDPEQAKRNQDAAIERNKQEAMNELERVVSGDEIGKEEVLPDIKPKVDYETLVNAANDWKYLVYARGGMARKSDLDAFLMQRFGIDSYEARQISNANEYTNSIPWRNREDGGVVWDEAKMGRPEPRLEDYPELEGMEVLNDTAYKRWNLEHGIGVEPGKTGGLDREAAQPAEPGGARSGDRGAGPRVERLPVRPAESSPDVATGGTDTAPYLRNLRRPDLTYDITNERVAKALDETIGQQTDVRRIMSAFGRGAKAYLLANGTGTGKTWVELGALVEMNPKRAVIVVPNRNNATDVSRVAKEYFGLDIDTGNTPPSGDAVWITTYTSLRDVRQWARKDFEVIIFDEAHKLKNYGSSAGSQQGEASVVLQLYNPDSKIIFSTATPFQSLTEARYLEKLGLWKGRSFDTWLVEHGYRWNQQKGYWRFQGTAKDILDVYRDMNEKGVFSQRELRMDARLKNKFVSVPMDSESGAAFSQMNALFDTAISTAPAGKKMLEAQRTMAARRIMELAKVPHAIELTRKLLKEGRQVAIFVGYRGEAKPPYFQSRYLRAVNPILEQIYDGINTMGTKSIDRLVQALGGPDVVAQVHGGVTTKSRDADIIAYNSGKKKVLVATAAAGGTGLSLHDTKGDAPRAQINVYLPWSGLDFAQVRGRSYRFGSKSDVVQYWLFADTDKEAQIASVVGGRLQEMGSLVSGIESNVDADRLAEFDFGMLDTSAGGLDDGGSNIFSQDELAMTRQRVRDRIRASFFSEKSAKEFGSDPDTMTDAVMSILDAHAQVWAVANNRVPDEWYSTHIYDIQRGGRPGKGALGQPETDWYYSKLERTIQEIPMEKMSVDQLRGILSKSGVKDDEMYWTGMDDYISRKRKVTRSELLDYMREMRIEIEDVVRLDKGYGSLETIVYADDYGNRVWEYPGDEYTIREIDQRPSGGTGSVYQVEYGTRIVKEFADFDDAEQYIQEVITPATIHNKWQLPGVRNDYTELALTVPRLFDMSKLGLFGRPLVDQPGVSTHFPESNILVWVRFNTRFDVDGRRMLFIEETQSDWHQAGRRRGYVTEIKPPETIEDFHKSYVVEELYDRWIIKTKKGNKTVIWYPKREIPGLDSVESVIATAIKELPGLAPITVGSVSPGPFSKTSDWSGLAFKRLLHWAAQNGYERIGWTTGQQQIDRYNLSHQVKYIGWEVDETGKLYDLTAESVDGQVLDLGEDLSIEDVADAVGKDVADRILADEGRMPYPGERLHSPYRDWRILEGDEQLSVGGEGMQGFYDTMLPNVVNKLVKRWGVKTGETGIWVGTAKAFEVSREEAAYLRNNGEKIWWAMPGHLDKQRPWTSVASLQPPDDAVFLRLEQAPDTVHYVDVTPTMKDSIRQGQALFQNQRASVEFMEDGRALIRAFKSADVSSALHEFSHVFLQDVPTSDQPIVTSWWKQNGVNADWQNGKLTGDIVKAQELWASGFEKYMLEGVAPSRGLRAVFAKVASWMKRIYENLIGIFPDVTPEMRGVYDRLFGESNTTGTYPVGSVQNTAPVRYNSQLESDFWAQRARTHLAELKSQVIAHGPEKSGGIVGDLTPEQRKLIDPWIKKNTGNMATAKIATIRAAEGLRDSALLNYTRRRGFDVALQVGWPYEFWYTRSALNWALRMFDRPSWYAMYYRLRKYMDSYAAMPGFPTRLRNRVGISAPYLPDWAGEKVYFDPLYNLFPFETFTTPVQQLQDDQKNITRNAAWILQSWSRSGKITVSEAQSAEEAQAGALWERALAEARRLESAENPDPLGWADLFISPNLFYSYPKYLAAGVTPPTLPITRTGQALQGALEGSPLEGIGNLVGGILAWPETALAKKRGFSEFGQWGDYYIDRMLSNMAADGTYDTQTVLQAMIEHSGPAYEEARRRVMTETAFRVPGGKTLYALSHAGEGTPLDYLTATLFTYAPSGLLPKGEMIQRGLQEEYNKARLLYNAGDKQALDRFFDEHPEYEARLALYDTPEERLRNFMISNVWERWQGMGSTEKQLASDTLGSLFQESFLDSETRNYDDLDTETLATWAKMLGNEVPNTPETSQVIQDPDIKPMESAPPEDIQEVDSYRQVRNQLFPNYYAIQANYYKARESYLTTHPLLKEYFEWDDKYRAANPYIDQYESFRSTIFPDWYNQQKEYYALPRSEREAYLADNPELAAYWDWNKEYRNTYPGLETYYNMRSSAYPGIEKELDEYRQVGSYILSQFPELAAYWEWNRGYKSQHPVIEKYSQGPGEDNYVQVYDYSFVPELESTLVRQLLGYYVANQSLSSGAMSELTRLWEIYGKGYLLQDWIDLVVRSVIAP